MVVGRLSLLAVVLGIAGLIPFLVCGFGAVWVRNALDASRLLSALIGYGAVILSFLGAVHWGLSLGDRSGRADRARLALGVLPSLIGWVALLALFAQVPIAALAILVMGFLVTVAAEQRSSRAGLLPRSYLVLRWGLSVVVVLDLSAVLVIRAVGLHLRG